MNPKYDLLLKMSKADIPAYKALALIMRDKVQPEFDKSDSIAKSIFNYMEKHNTFWASVSIQEDKEGLFLSTWNKERVVEDEANPEV